jgi:aspartyl-tRNA(Asn)/glutamyl-tRNA(Gln) amidotransferase subunit A
MTASDPCFLSVAEAASLIGSKRLSPVELTQAYLARIERLDGRLHAYVRVLPDEALAAARAAEAEIAAGRYRGPLHGIPIGLKDIYDTAGVATEGGSKLCLGRVPTADATTTRLLKQAGAILLGKLTTWEFAIGGTAFDTPFPPARNPWNTDRDPAGHRRVDPLAGRLVRTRRSQADLRAGQPRWDHAAVVQPRPCWATGLDR